MFAKSVSSSFTCILNWYKRFRAMMEQDQKILVMDTASHLLFKILEKTFFYCSCK